MTNRRDFLRNASAFGLFSGAGMMSTLCGFSALAADTSGYKALVCVFLFGGIDNHDTVIPYNTTDYNRYSDIRQQLMGQYATGNANHSRLRANLLPLSPGNAAAFGARQFALPQDLEPLHRLFGQGRAAIVGNVGPLLEPITRRQYQDNVRLRPSRLFSHNDQQSTWMALQPEGARFGWGGALADAHLAVGANANPAFTAVSISGNSVFLSGSRARSYKIGSGGVETIDALDPRRLDQNERLSDDALDLMREHFMGAGVGSDSLFADDLIVEKNASVEVNQLFNDSADAAAPLLTTFPSTSLGKQLRTVAETIRLRDDLGIKRQVFFVSTGGFDTHASQASKLPGLQRTIADAMAAFYDATDELGVANSVTAFTASDFGRTLTINDDGTDHGWGGHHFVVGGAVRGGDIYGDLPPFDLDHDNDAGRGRLIPSVSIEQYAATLGKWFGLSNSELNAALPRLTNFAQRDLMFL